MSFGFNERTSNPERPHVGQLLLACGLVTGLILAAAVTWYATMSRRDVIADAVREMRNAALVLTEDEDRLLLTVDAAHRGLIDHMRQIGVDTPEQSEQLMASPAMHQYLRDRIDGLAGVRVLSLVDGNGTRVNSSRAWPPAEFNDAARNFVRELLSAGSPVTFISAPSVDRTNRPIIRLSRRFDAADGKLIGFVISTIQLENFERSYARLPLTGGGSFALFRRDGTLITRYPHTDRAPDRSSVPSPNFIRLLAAVDKDPVHLTSRFDGEDRLVVPRAMAHFPLIVTVSDTLVSILRSWWNGVRVLIAVTAVLELMIAGITLLAVRHLRGRERLHEAEAARTAAEADLILAGERERAADALRMQRQRFDTALRNMRQGLVMIADDGTLLVVNRRFHEMFGLPPDIVTSGMTYADMANLLTSPGNLQTADLAMLIRRRKEWIERQIHTSLIWELADGRAFTVDHQPMEGGWLTTFEDITERRAADARITHLAHHDALTDLPNRVQFRETVEHALAFARRGHLLAVHFLDLDQFKAVNDTLGHPIGDRLLQAVAERLGRTVRETDTVARLGGDEFAILQTAIGSPIDATELASRLIETIGAPFEIDGHQIVIGTSIGIAFAPDDGLDVDQLLKCVDLALYRAKIDGRGVYRLFRTGMDAAMQARRSLELDLRQALQAGQLELFYQPQIDLRTRRAAGCEALLRWRHPTKGLISPDRFIPLAEETGLIVPIGAWVLLQACTAAAKWPEGMKIAVNLSPVQFKSPDLVGAIVTALRTSGLHPSRLELEITETVMLHDTDATLATLHQLRQLGIQIAMDDFGTGYSSLSYLRRFPFDRIKIDQSFVRELGKREDCAAIVRAVITLGRDLGMKITAEGVETWQQLYTLEQAGCAEIQGYLFSRPVPEVTAAKLLRSVPGVAQAWPFSGADLAEPDPNEEPRAGAARTTDAGSKPMELVSV